MVALETPAGRAASVEIPDAMLARAVAERDAALEDAEFLREYMQSARAYLAHVVDAEEAEDADELDVGDDAPIPHRRPGRSALGTLPHASTSAGPAAPCAVRAANYLPGPASTPSPISVVKANHDSVRHPDAATIVEGDSLLRNRLLAALPPDDLVDLGPHLVRVRLEEGEILFESHAPIRHVYFPETAVVSLVSRLGGRGSVAVGTAGYEGLVGLPVFLSADESSQALAQIPGTAQRMEVEAFARLASAPGALQRMLLRYTQAFLTQVAQTAVCNAGHLVEERCARWLLMTHDRVNGDEFPLRYEFLAFMLAVRNGGAIMAVRKLQSAGLVHYDRGRVSIIDRFGLEEAACECYGVVRAHFNRLLPTGG